MARIEDLKRSSSQGLLAKCQFTSSGVRNVCLAAALGVVSLIFRPVRAYRLGDSYVLFFRNSVWRIGWFDGVKGEHQYWSDRGCGL